MIIRGATKDDLETALAKVNERYAGNVCWNRFTNEGRGFRVTLKVRNSKASGARRGQTGRRMINACWHVHGYFFDALPKNSIIVLGAGGIHRPGDPWQDRNIGSIMEPLYFSEACDCNRY